MTLWPTNSLSCLVLFDRFLISYFHRVWYTLYLILWYASFFIVIPMCNFDCIHSFSVVAFPPFWFNSLSFLYLPHSYIHSGAQDPIFQVPSCPDPQVLSLSLSFPAEFPLRPFFGHSWITHLNICPHKAPLSKYSSKLSLPCILSLNSLYPLVCFLQSFLKSDPSKYAISVLIVPYLVGSWH